MKVRNLLNDLDYRIIEDVIIMFLSCVYLEFKMVNEEFIVVGYGFERDVEVFFF